MSSPLCPFRPSFLTLPSSCFRFTDSPEPGGKGRGKRGRCTNTPSEPEPRKNLRSSKQKGKGGGKGGNGGAAAVKGSGSDEFAFPAPSSPAKDGKRKKEATDQQEDGKKRKRTSSDSDESSSAAPEDIKPSSVATASATVVPKREPKPVVFSYKMLECPRKDCNKQYKHDEGLKWHLSHSHPEYIGPDGEVSTPLTGKSLFSQISTYPGPLFLNRGYYCPSAGEIGSPSNFT